jgi:hypothetical protein
MSWLGSQSLKPKRFKESKPEHSCEHTGDKDTVNSFSFLVTKKAPSWMIQASLQACQQSSISCMFLPYFRNLVLIDCPFISIDQSAYEQIS